MECLQHKQTFYGRGACLQNDRARFEQARRAMLPLAEAQGFLTDEDVFADVS